VPPIWTGKISVAILVLAQLDALKKAVRRMEKIFEAAVGTAQAHVCHDERGAREERLAIKAERALG